MMPERFSLTFSYCGKTYRYVIAEFNERFWIVTFRGRVLVIVNTLEEAFKELSDIVNVGYMSEEVNF